MVKSAIILLLSLTYSSLAMATFSSGQIISSDEINAEFGLVKEELTVRGHSYEYSLLGKGQRISAGLLNSNFNNFKNIDLLVSSSLLALETLSGQK